MIGLLSVMETLKPVISKSCNRKNQSAFEVIKSRLKLSSLSAGKYTWQHLEYLFLFCSLFLIGETFFFSKIFTKGMAKIKLTVISLPWRKWAVRLSFLRSSNWTTGNPASYETIQWTVICHSSLSYYFPLHWPARACRHYDQRSLWKNDSRRSARESGSWDAFRPKMTSSRCQLVGRWMFPYSMVLEGDSKS